MKITRDVDPPVLPKVLCELRHAIYRGPLTYLTGEQAHVLMRCDRPGVLRAKITGARAGKLGYEWTEFPRDEFEIGELIEKA